MKMKNIIKLEELALFAISIYALSLMQPPWWVYLLLALGPDISMIGYLGGNRSGAFLYNVFHHKGVAAAVFASGLLFNNFWLQVTGIVLFGHSSMDRFFGYGLKTSKGFKDTHLGLIGKN